MRGYILTRREIQVIQRFLSNGERLEGYAMLLFRCRKYLPKLEQQMELIQKFIEKDQRSF